jgi:hypothetical protein
MVLAALTLIALLTLSLVAGVAVITRDIALERRRPAPRSARPHRTAEPRLPASI